MKFSLDNIRISKLNAVQREIEGSVLYTVFVPILADDGDGCLIMEGARSRAQSVEIRVLKNLEEYDECIKLLALKFENL